MMLGYAMIAAMRKYEAGDRSETETTASVDGLYMNGFRAAFGLFPGLHFRREDGPGCFHARVYQGVTWIHYDGYDPRRYPLQHLAEVISGFTGGTSRLWRK